jgi:hypothetical protein
LLLKRFRRQGGARRAGHTHAGAGSGETFF